MEDETSPFVNGDICSFFWEGVIKMQFFFQCPFFRVVGSTPFLPKDLAQPSYSQIEIALNLPGAKKKINHEKVVVAKPSNLKKTRIFLNFESSIFIYFFSQFFQVCQVCSLYKPSRKSIPSPYSHKPAITKWVPSLCSYN